jgi:hypothetical protein
MSAVGLAIVEPTHNRAFTGTPSVTFRGELTDVPEEVEGVTLYYRWYSSLFSGSEVDIAQERFAMNVVEGVVLTDPESAYIPAQPLGIGTHVISFATTDQSDETAAAQEAVQHGGVTGGAEGDGQCIIHVFKANLLTPGSGALLSRASSILEAESPALWGIEIDGTGVYEPNEEYHKLNRLQYRWTFTPVGAPSGRATVDFVPTVAQLVFQQPATATEVKRLRYQGALPSELTGRYNLTLHVEDKEGQLGGHTMTVTNIQVGP